MAVRRDVRRFRTDPVDEALLVQCLDTIRMAPSVGLSEPWRIVRVESDLARHAALENHRQINAEALAGYAGETAEQYAKLKLSGMTEAPVHIAVFCDDGTAKGRGLGARTMPEMRKYSVVSAVTLLWLSLRAHGLGMGWVSILDPMRLAQDLEIPSEWALIGYFCIGWPQENTTTPELEILGWGRRAGSLSIETR